MTPIRVVMVAPTPFFSDRGCHVRILEEARALEALGVEVTVCTYFLGDSPPGLRLRRGLRFPGYAKRSAGPSWTKPLMDLDLWRLTTATVREVKPHILHAHLHEGMAVAAFVPGGGVPLMDYQGSLSGELADHGIPSWGVSVFRAVERWINRRPAHVLTSHRSAAEHLTQAFQMPSDRITVTGDAGTPVAPDPARVQALRERWGLNPEKPVVVYTGLLGSHQGTETLLHLGRELRKHPSGARLLVCGFPEETWARRAEAQGLKDTVVFTGRFDYRELPHLLALGAVAVSPKTSASEGNQKLYPYLHAGLPVVAFDTAVNREILGEAGELAPPQAGAKGFQRRVTALLEDEAARRAAAERSRRRAGEVGGWDAVGRRILEVYRRLLG